MRLIYNHKVVAKLIKSESEALKTAENLINQFGYDEITLINNDIDTDVTGSNHVTQYFNGRYLDDLR